MPRNTFEGILSKLCPCDDGCVLWTGPSMKHGYCVTSWKSKPWLIHRLFYYWFVGPIPVGMELHHTCRNKRCVNVLHLRPVTKQEHILLDNTFGHVHSLKTHCPAGHPYEGKNLTRGSNREGPHRKCRTCIRERNRKGGSNADKTHCLRGHPYSDGIDKMEGGRRHRRCQVCRKEQAATRQAQKNQSLPL